MEIQCLYSNSVRKMKLECRARFDQHPVQRTLCQSGNSAVLGVFRWFWMVLARFRCFLTVFEWFWMDFRGRTALFPLLAALTQRAQSLALYQCANSVLHRVPSVFYGTLRDS